MSAVCPQNPEHRQFVTVVTLLQDWRVDGDGNFIEEVGCGQVSSGPDPSNIWRCAECGTEAVVE